MPTAVPTALLAEAVKVCAATVGASGEAAGLTVTVKVEVTTWLDMSVAATVIRDVPGVRKSKVSLLLKTGSREAETTAGLELLVIV